MGEDEVLLNSYEEGMVLMGYTIVQFMASEGWGGAENVFVMLANELAKKHDVTAILLRNTVYRHRFSEAVHIQTLRANPTRYNPLLSLELFFLLKKLQPDIVHTHAAKATELIRFLASFLKFNHVGTKHNSRKGRVFNTIPRVTAVSKIAAQSVEHKNNRSVRVIANGIEPVCLPTIEKDQPFTLLAIGRLDKIKGFEVLIEQLQNISFDFRLYIVGEGPEQENLQTAIDKSGASQRIVLTGLREDIPQLMKKSHLVVISSESEGFGLVLIESLFYADCVISTPVGESVAILPEIFLAPQEKLGEKIEEVHANYQHFITEFDRIKRSKGKLYLLPEISRCYVDLYRKIIEDPKKL